MTSTKMFTLFAALAFLLALPTLAVADPMYFQFAGNGAVDTTVINGSAVGNVAENVYVGQFIGVLSANIGFSPATTYNTFCVDLSDNVVNGQDYLVNVRSTNDGLNRGEQIAFLYNSYGIAPIGDADTAAALQLAIWDELANNGQGQFSVGATLSYNLTDPSSGHYNATVAADLAAFLAAANASSGALAGWLDSHVAAPEPEGFHLGQGFLAPNPPSNQTPEPSSLVLLAIGAIGLASFARRKRRRT